MRLGYESLSLPETSIFKWNGYIPVPLAGAGFSGRISRSGINFVVINLP